MLLCVALGAGCGRLGYDSLQPEDAGTDDAGAADAGAADAAGPAVQLGPEVVLELGPGTQDNPMGIWESGRLVIGWTGSGDNAQVASLNEQGVVTDGPFSISGGLVADDCWLATSGTRLGAVWLEGVDPATARVYFRLLLPTGEPDTAAVVLSPAGVEVKDPSVGWTGSRFLVTWRENTATSSFIHRAIISPAGIIESPNELFYVSGASQTEAELRSISGTLHATWRDGGQILVSEISSAGILGAPRTITTNAAVSHEPSIAGDGGEFAVAYHNRRNGFYGVYLSFDGSESTELEVEPAPAQDTAGVTLAKGQDVYGLIWDGVNASGVDGFTEYAVVSRSGGILAKGPLSEFAHAASAHPTIVWTGDAFLAVWEYRVDAADRLGLRRITPSN